MAVSEKIRTSIENSSLDPQHVRGRQRPEGEVRRGCRLRLLPRQPRRGPARAGATGPRGDRRRNDAAQTRLHAQRRLPRGARAGCRLAVRGAGRCSLPRPCRDVLRRGRGAELGAQGTPQPRRRGDRHRALLHGVRLLRRQPRRNARARGGRADFDLDVEAIEAKIGPRTAALIVNSPNNPTGRIYPEAHPPRPRGHAPRRLAKARPRDLPPLRRALPASWPTMAPAVPSILAAYPHSIVATSHSKDLSLPGESIGYVAVNPAADDAPRAR